MLIEVCKSKIVYATITEAELLYEGSLTIDENLMKATNIVPGERVQVVNINNGNRFETYTISGKPGSGIFCLNGPAARLGLVGDQIMVLSYALMEPEEARNNRLKIIHLDEQNKIKD